MSPAGQHGLGSEPVGKDSQNVENEKAAHGHRYSFG